MKETLDTIQARIQHLKEVSQTEEIVMFPFISFSDIFYLSQVSLSKVRDQDSRYGTGFFYATHRSMQVNRLGAQISYVS